MMKQLHWLPAARSGSTIAGSDADDALYEAALASLLAQVARPPGLLDRLWRTIWSWLTQLHARRRADGEQLPPECWHLPC
jgi:hypothetical protein